MDLSGCSEMFYKDFCLKFAYKFAYAQPCVSLVSQLAFAVFVISVIIIAKSLCIMMLTPLSPPCGPNRCEILIGAFARMIFGTFARR